MALRKQRERTEEVLNGQSTVEEQIGEVTPPERQQIEPLPPMPPGGAVSTTSPVQTLIDWLVDRASRTDEDEWAQMESAVGRILSGGSAEEVLQRDLPISGKTFVNRPFWLHGFTLTSSDFAEGPIPFYANLDVTIAGGERRVVNCGGAKVLAKLKVLDDEGDYPYSVMLASDQTQRGFTVLDLVRPV